MKAEQTQMDFGELEQNQPGKEHHAFIAKRLAESPAGMIRLMESICGQENIEKALQRVEQNAGAPGVDGMKTTQLRGYLRRHWEKIKARLLDGSYKPWPVRRKEIGKPDGGVRQLGIPTVLDRLIQQAMAQVLKPIEKEPWDHQGNALIPCRENRVTFSYPLRISLISPISGEVLSSVSFGFLVEDARSS